MDTLLIIILVFYRLHLVPIKEEKITFVSIKYSNAFGENCIETICNCVFIYDLNRKIKLLSLVVIAQPLNYFFLQCTDNLFTFVFYNSHKINNIIIYMN